MQKAQAKPQAQYVVQVGLTRRLVSADSPEDAKQEFIQDRLMRSFLGDLDDAMHVRLATELEIAEFTNVRRPTFDGQTTLELDDVREGYGKQP